MAAPIAPPRLYQSPADLEAIHQLLRAGLASGSACYYVHPGDINWWLFYPPIGQDLFQHTRLWDDPDQAGRALGWMLVDPSWPSFEVFVQPELYGTPVGAAMYTWAEEQAVRQMNAEQTALHKLWVAEDDAIQHAHLTRHGFQPGSWDALLQCDLNTLGEPNWRPPAGWQVRPCGGAAEVAARATAQHGSFGSRAPFPAYLERFERLTRSTAYAAALDMVAVAPDGQIGAFCLAWSDPATGRGHLEPVGTHPSFQRRGLGKAVVGAALLHLRAAGLRSVSVCTPETNTAAVGLYQSVGFRLARRLGLYKKEFAANETQAA